MLEFEIAAELRDQIIRLRGETPEPAAKKPKPAAGKKAPRKPKKG